MLQASPPETEPRVTPAEERPLTPLSEWKDIVAKVQYYGFDLAQRFMEILDGGEARKTWTEQLQAFEVITNPLDRACALVGAWQTFPLFSEEHNSRETIRFVAFADLILDLLARTPINRTKVVETDQVLATEQKIVLFENLLEQTILAIKAHQLLGVTAEILTDSDKFPIHPIDLLVAVTEVFTEKADILLRVLKEAKPKTEKDSGAQIAGTSTALANLSLTVESRNLVTPDVYTAVTELVKSEAGSAWEKIRRLMVDLHNRAQGITGVDSAEMQRVAREKEITI